MSNRTDRDLQLLDDHEDREELRNRYYGLLQELRVVLPGVQVLLAFLFAVPFAEGFTRLDSFGRAVFAIAILATLLAVICMLAPAAMHRFGERTARRARLAWSIRLTMAGLVFLGIALVAALFAVARFIYGMRTALLVVVPVSIAIATLWWLLPMTIGRIGLHPVDDTAEPDDTDDPDDTGDPGEPEGSRGVNGSGDLTGAGGDRDAPRRESAAQRSSP